MAADEPDFQHYPKTCAEFAGVVAKEISGRLLNGAVWLLDRLRQIAVPDRVQRPVRGWEGRVWEVGDGEVDGPVSAGGLQAERELLDDPAVPVILAEMLTRFTEHAARRDDVVAGVDLDAIREFPDDSGPTG